MTARLGYGTKIEIEQDGAWAKAVGIRNADLQRVWDAVFAARFATFGNHHLMGWDAAATAWDATVLADRAVAALVAQQKARRAR